MSYVAGTEITLEVSLLDATSVPIDAVSIQYEVVNGNGDVVQELTTLSGFTGGSEATVTIPIQSNTLDQGLEKDIREIAFICTLEDGSKKVTYFSYFIESGNDRLRRGVNTMVTLAGAELLASDMPNMAGWKASTRAAKESALVIAYRNLGKLRFASLNNFYYSNDVFKSETAVSLTDLSSAEVMALDNRLKIALSYAQVAEADSILSGDSGTTRREDGIILETIGEVKKMYRNGKPIDMPVSKRTMSYISQYTTIGAKVTGRV